MVKKQKMMPEGITKAGAITIKDSDRNDNTDSREMMMLMFLLLTF